mgnify:CR=1 FL=1
MCVSQALMDLSLGSLGHTPYPHVIVWLVWADTYNPTHTGPTHTMLGCLSPPNMAAS